MDAKYPRLSLKGFETEEEKRDRFLRARKEAKKAAEFLKAAFGVKEVLLFGSLLDEDVFSRHSDIDLAVRGLPVDVYYQANGKLLDVIEGFSFDLVDMDTCKPEILMCIQREGVNL